MQYESAKLNRPTDATGRWVLSPIAGRLVDRFGPRVLLTIGGMLASLGFLLLARPGLTAGPIDYWRHFFSPLTVLGLAMGLSTLLVAILISQQPQRSNPS